VCTLKEEALQGNLEEALMFLFTDNSTTKAGLTKKFLIRKEALGEYKEL
jgi:hypothetical protein